MKRSSFLLLFTLWSCIAVSAPVQFHSVSADGNLNAAPMMISEVHLHPSGTNSSIAIYDAVDATGAVSSTLIWSGSGPAVLDKISQVFPFTTYVFATTGPYVDLTNATALLGIVNRPDDRVLVRYSGTPEITVFDEERGEVTFVSGGIGHLSPSVALPLLGGAGTWTLVGPAETPTPTSTPTNTPTATDTPTATPTNVVAVAVITASTNDGLAPLAVSFILAATDTDGYVANYSLYSASGVLHHQYNYYDTLLAYTQSITYSVPGSYVATFSVTDSGGEVTSATAAIAVSTYTPTQTPTETPTPTATPTYAAPVVALVSVPNPASGTAPLSIAFVGSATGVDDDLAIYRWYWESPSLGASGALSSATTIQAATNVYSSTGSYTVKFEVEDGSASVSSVTAAVTVN